MKKKLLLIPLAVILITVFLIKGNIFFTTKTVLDIKPTQYFGMTVDMSQILPESQHYVLNSKKQDLIDIGANLGMNTFRITNITSPTDSETHSYSQSQWKEVLDRLKSKNMYAVILIESNSSDQEFFSQNLGGYYLNFVKKYINDGNLCSFSNIIAVDIRNEPILTPNNLEVLNEASKDIKTICPTMKITIGSWGVDSGHKTETGDEEIYWHDPRGVPLIVNFVDLLAVHIYGFDKPVNGPYPDPYTLTTGYLNEVRKYTQKPIFIEEFGAGNGDGLTDQNTLGSPELQKQAYEGLLRAAYDFRNKGVLGATGYLFYPRTEGPDSWSILKDNANTFLPAANQFKTISNLY